MKETKTVQVYPSDAIVNETIGEHESFGWEVVSNQRCQEYEGTTYNAAGSTKHYSTFNKLTFSREKDAAWHDEVSQIEKEFYIMKDSVQAFRAGKPVLREPALTGTGAVAVGLWLYMMLILPGVIFTIVHCAKKAKYKKKYQKELAEYNAVYPAQIRNLESKMAELRARSEKCISGKA